MGPCPLPCSHGTNPLLCPTVCPSPVRPGHCPSPAPCPSPSLLPWWSGPGLSAQGARAWVNPPPRCGWLGFRRGRLEAQAGAGPGRHRPPLLPRRLQGGQAPWPAGSAVAWDPEQAARASRVAGGWPAGRKHAWTAQGATRPPQAQGCRHPAVALSRALEAGSFALRLPTARVEAPVWTRCRSPDVHTATARGGGRHTGHVLRLWGHLCRAKWGEAGSPGSPPGPVASVGAGASALQGTGWGQAVRSVLSSVLQGLSQAES